MIHKHVFVTFFTVLFLLSSYLTVVVVAAPHTHNTNTEAQPHTLHNYNQYRHGTIKLSFRSHRNETGHWIAQVRECGLLVTVIDMVSNL